MLKTRQEGTMQLCVMNRKNDVGSHGAGELELQSHAGRWSIEGGARSPVTVSLKAITDCHQLAIINEVYTPQGR